MVNFNELMQIFTTPRHNGTKALEETFQKITEWLNTHSIFYTIHEYRLYPYIFIATGIWIIISRTLLAISIWFKWGWACLLIAIISLLGGYIDVAFGFPLISWMGRKIGKNIIIQFSPDTTPQQELIFSAHYDTKTEVLDHIQRMFFLKNIPLGIILTLFIGVAGALVSTQNHTSSAIYNIIYLLGVIATVPLLLLAWGLGINLSFGWLKEPSEGAVDNGAACAILLSLSQKLNRKDIHLQKTSIKLILFSGEEVNMQGSTAYVNDLIFDIPTYAVNLEVMAQNGDYVYWEQDGTSLKLLPTSAMLNKLFVDIVMEVTNIKPIPGEPINSDGGSFLRKNIPATTIGTYDKVLKERGFHSKKDNIGRVALERIPEGVTILTKFIQNFESRPNKKN